MTGRFKFGPNVLWAGVAKVVEEMGELAQPLGKLIMIEGRTDHWSGDLRKPIVEEAADVMAAVQFLADHNFSADELRQFNSRVDRKLAQFNKWHEEGED